MQQTLARSLADNGEWMDGITDGVVLGKLHRLADELDEATAAAARSIGVKDLSQQPPRWSDWLPPEPAEGGDPPRSR